MIKKDDKGFMQANTFSLAPNGQRKQIFLTPNYVEASSGQGFDTVYGKMIGKGMAVCCLYITLNNSKSEVNSEAQLSI